jgi:hypothetical protein
MRQLIPTEKGKLMFKSFLVIFLGLAAFVVSPKTSMPEQLRQRTQCVSESGARAIAEEISVPDYPEDGDPASSKGLVFAAVLFDSDGKLSKIKFYETPNPQAADAVKKALEKWRLMKLFGGGGEPTMTKTAVRFHFVFEGEKGRVDPATEKEQAEFGGKWGLRVCGESFEE